MVLAVSDNLNNW